MTHHMKNKRILVTSLAAIALIIGIAGIASAKTNSTKHITGTVQSISGDSLTIKKGSKTYTVDTDSNTKIENKKDKSIKLSDIQKGNHVKVTGSIAGQTITATIVKDKSLK